MPPPSRRAGDAAGDRHDDDASAFAEAVRGVRKLGGGPSRVSAAYPVLLPGAPRAKIQIQPQVVWASRGRAPEALAPPGFAIEDSGEVWTARADGVDRRTLRKLRSGNLPVEGRLDLHGLTRARAIDALARFLAASRAVGRRCLLIIHGRGLHSGREGPTLRDAVRAELITGAQAGATLACGTAPPSLGGEGAMLVLFRR